MELLPEVEGLLDALFWDRDDATKRLDALERLRRAASCEACVEEIRRLNGVDRLRKALRWDDETAVDVAASVIAACSGSTARGPGVRSLVFGAHEVSVRETDYVEGGLGWRVWASGVVMCRALVERAEEMRLAGADVLEVGAGCGIAGFLAARLGARRVTFTDYLPGLLRNLDASVELNRAARPDAEFRVKHLEWLSAVPGLAEKFARPMGGDGSCAANEEAHAAMVRDRSLAEDERFQLIIGSDVCYEDPLPTALAAVLRARLAPGGRAWLTLPVRDWPGVKGAEVIQRLVDEMRARGLEVETEKAEDLREEEYEGGTFVKHEEGMVHVWARLPPEGEEAGVAREVG